MTPFTTVERTRLTLTNTATPTACIAIPPGKYRVDINFAPGASGTITPKYGYNSDELKPCEIGSTAIELTASGGFLIDGPTNVAFVASGISGTIVAEVSRL